MYASDCKNSLCDSWSLRRLGNPEASSVGEHAEEGSARWPHWSRNEPMLEVLGIGSHKSSPMLSKGWISDRMLGRAIHSKMIKINWCGEAASGGILRGGR